MKLFKIVLTILFITRLSSPSWSETHYYKNGQISDEGDYQDGASVGYWSNGALKYKGNWSNSKETGFWVVYYKNGQLEFTGSYHLGGKVDAWVYYYDNGQIERKVTTIEEWKMVLGMVTMRMAL